MTPTEKDTYTAVCDATIATYDRVSMTYSEQVCAWMLTDHSEEAVLRLGERHDKAHQTTAETIRRVREGEPLRPHEHVHGPQCTQESCPSATLYYHAGEGCPPAGTRVCAGHPLPSRAELVAASKKRRGRATENGVAKQDTRGDIGNAE